MRKSAVGRGRGVGGGGGGSYAYMRARRGSHANGERLAGQTDSVTATSNAHIITLGKPEEEPTVTAIDGMAFQRSLANGAVLPDGTVFIVGWAAADVAANSRLGQACTCTSVTCLV